MRVHVGLGEAVKSGTAKSDDTAEQPIPGLGDVCGHLSDAQKCSPAICDMKPHTRVQLEAKVYYIDREVLLPEGAQLIGAGVNKTRIVACGEPSSGRRTLVLNNDSYAGHFTFQGKSATRGNFEGAVGTPGCLSTTCAPALAGVRFAYNCSEASDSPYSLFRSSERRQRPLQKLQSAASAIFNSRTSPRRRVGF